MPSAPSIVVDLRPSRLLGTGLVMGFLAAGIAIFVLSDIPMLFAVPLMLLVIGLEGRYWSLQGMVRRLVLHGTGSWRMDSDEQPWALTSTQRFPFGLMLHFRAEAGADTVRPLMVLRDQADTDSWRLLNAWVRAPRSIRMDVQGKR